MGWKARRGARRGARRVAAAARIMYIRRESIRRTQELADVSASSDVSIDRT